MIRPLLGEIGETISRALRRAAFGNEPAWLSRGIVGFAFQPEEATSPVFMFAETIRQDDHRQDAEDRKDSAYSYSADIPYVATLRTIQGAREYYLQEADLRDPDIGDALALSQPAPRQNSFVNLIVHEIASRVSLYAVFGSDADAESMQHTSKEIASHLQAAKTYVKVLTNNAIFLAEANARGQARTSELFSRLRALLEIDFNEFDRYEKAQRDLVREIGAATPWLTKQYDRPASKSGHIPPWLQDIANGEVTVLRKLGESFRDDAATYLVEVEALDPPHGEQGATRNGDRYTAIVKLSTRESTIKGLAGYFRLQQRFDVLGGALPPAPAAWPTARGGKGDPYVLVTPRVSGEPLSEFLASRWEHAWTFDGDRVVTISRFVDRLVAFADALAGHHEESQRGDASTPCRAHYGWQRKWDKDVHRKWEKTLFALRVALVDDQTPTLRYGNQSFPNPLVWFNKITSQEYSPAENMSFVRQATIHGDLHAGNVLVQSPDHVIVHDFDYVGDGYRYQDHATLEASLLVALARSTRYENEGRWKATFVPLLTGLARQIGESRPDRAILGEEDAYDIWRVIQRVRATPLRHGSLRAYRAILLREVLRLTASTVRLRRRPIGDPRAPMMTGILYVGLLLDSMEERNDGADGAASELTFTPVERFFDDDHKLTVLAVEVVRALKRGDGRPTEKEVSMAEERTWLTAALGKETSLEGQHSLTRLIRRLGDIDAKKGAVQALFGASPARSDGEDDDRILQARSTTKTTTRATGTLGSYYWAFVTDIGKNTDAAKQGDAALAAEVQGKSIFAVADGTGDSDRSDWVSRTALAHVLSGVAETGHDLLVSVVDASLTLQMENRSAHEDNACCFAGASIDTDACVVVAAGDSRFVDATTVFPELPKGNGPGERRVLGGLDGSSIITSGGNLVGQVKEAGHLKHRALNPPRRFALVTDGAFASSSDAARALEEIRVILSRSTSALQAAQDIVDRALRIFRAGDAKEDNVTALVAFASESSA